MKLVILKNGKEFKITQEQANILTQRISSGCPSFQCFSTEGYNTTELIINLNEVAAIISNENIA